jgi:hypothetical protein
MSKNTKPDSALLGDDPGNSEKTAKPAEGKELRKDNIPAPAPNPSKTSFSQNKDIVAETKSILEKQPKVLFMIPIIPGETTEETVQINGYRLTIKKGEQVEIPQAVAKLLAEKYRINMQAGQKARIDRDSKVTEALS